MNAYRGRISNNPRTIIRHPTVWNNIQYEVGNALSFGFTVQLAKEIKRNYWSPQVIIMHRSRSWKIEAVNRRTILNSEFNGRSIIVYDKKAQDWLDALNRYQLLLAAIVHLVGGQPPLATELLSVRNANIEFNDRSIIVYDNVVMVWIHHSKNTWRYGKTKPVPRFVPAEVGSHLMLLSLVGARLKVVIQDIVLDKASMPMFSASTSPSPTAAAALFLPTL